MIGQIALDKLTTEDQDSLSAKLAKAIMSEDRFWRDDILDFAGLGVSGNTMLDAKIDEFAKGTKMRVDAILKEEKASGAISFTGRRKDMTKAIVAAVQAQPKAA